MSKSQLEEEFLTRWLQLAPDEPQPVREYAPIPGRRFRFDFCWPSYDLALEIQGGSRMQGRHNRAEGQRADYEKHNLVTSRGWRVLYATGEMLHSDPAGLIDLIARLLN